jgi:glycosyltransferase involved in cell wall biosynthesis
MLQDMTNQLTDPQSGERTPQVSIGMLVFNGEQYIREALDSLLVQTFPDFELIISDDASTDRTAEICLEYAAQDQRIRYIRQPENQGIWANYNLVLQQARAEYFMWAAHDDIWAPNWIHTLLGNMSKECVISFGRSVVIKPDGEVCGWLPPVQFQAPKALRLLKLFWVRSDQCSLMYGIYRREYLLSIGGIETPRVNKDAAADYYFLYRVLHDGHIICDPSTTLFKRQGGYSSTYTGRWPRLRHLFPTMYLYSYINLMCVPSPLGMRIILGLNLLPHFLYILVVQYIAVARSVWKRIAPAHSR